MGPAERLSDGRPGIFRDALRPSEKAWAGPQARHQETRAEAGATQGDMTAYNWHTKPTFWQRNGRRLIAVATIAALGMLMLAGSYLLQVA